MLSVAAEVLATTSAITRRRHSEEEKPLSAAAPGPLDKHVRRQAALTLHQLLLMKGRLLLMKSGLLLMKSADEEWAAAGGNACCFPLGRSWPTSDFAAEGLVRDEVALA